LKDGNESKNEEVSKGYLRPDQRTQIGFKEDPMSVYKELYLDEIHKQNKIRFEFEQKDLERKRMEIKLEEILKENENLKRQKSQRDELIEQLTK
jgi:hypothetical protein